MDISSFPCYYHSETIVSEFVKFLQKMFWCNFIHFTVWYFNEYERFCDFKQTRWNCKTFIYTFFTLLKLINRARKIRFSGTRKSVLLKASSGEHCASRNFVLLVALGGTCVCLIAYLVVCTKWNRLWKDRCWNKFTYNCIHLNDLNDLETLRNMNVPLVYSLLTLKRFHTFY